MINEINVKLYLIYLLFFSLTSCKSTNKFLGMYKKCSLNDCLVLKLQDNNQYECYVNNHMIGEGYFTGKYQQKKDTILLNIPNNHQEELNLLKKEYISQVKNDIEIKLLDKKTKEAMIGFFVTINDSITKTTDLQGRVIFNEKDIKNIKIYNEGILLDVYSFTITNKNINYFSFEVSLGGMDLFMAIDTQWYYSNGKLYSLKSIKKNGVKRKAYYITHQKM